MLNKTPLKEVSRTSFAKSINSNNVISGSSRVMNRIRAKRDQMNIQEGNIEESSVQ
jgi:hypothetical protein